jgi:hypothetical protein
MRPNNPLRIVGGVLLAAVALIVFRVSATAFMHSAFAESTTPGELGLARITLLGATFTLATAVGALVVRSRQRYWAAIPAVAYLLLVSPACVLAPHERWKVELGFLYLGCIALGIALVDVVSRVLPKRDATPRQ